jgi:hypothetical protein
MTLILKIIGQCDVKHILTSQIKTIMPILKISTYIITSITGRPVRLSSILAIMFGQSWSWSYGSWIYNYLCNQYLSLLMLWVPTMHRQGVLDTTLCDKVCQWLVGGFPRVLRINYIRIFNDSTYLVMWSLSKLYIVMWSLSKLYMFYMLFAYQSQHRGKDVDSRVFTRMLRSKNLTRWHWPLTYDLENQ